MAAQHADFVLIPTKSAVFDTMSMTHTLDVVNQLNKPSAVVLTFVSPQGTETADAIAAVEQLGADVCPNHRQPQGILPRARARPGRPGI
jgi:chromosome partitioning protein